MATACGVWMISMGVGTASAQLGAPEQTCLDQYSKRTAKIAAAQNKTNRACIKNATKGKEPGSTNIAACLSADSKSLVAKAAQKLADATSGPGGKCDAIVAPPVAGIYSAPSVGSSASIDGSIRFAEALFGEPIASATFNAADKARGSCQDSIYKRVHKIFDTGLKAFRGCQKASLKAGVVTDNVTLAGCVDDAARVGSLAADTKGKLGKAATKMATDFTKRCASGVTLNDAFPGDCVDGGVQNDFVECVESEARCAACLTLNGANNMDVDCEAFDDGTANASCITPVDIILFVDNSGSMTEEITALQSGINDALIGPLEAGGVDYRVILISTHGDVDVESVCIEEPLSGIPAGGCAVPPAQPVFTDRFYHYSLDIGSRNGWCQLLNSFNASDGFGLLPNGWGHVLRPDALKTIVALTDDEVFCTLGATIYDDLGTAAGGEAAAAAFDAALMALSPVHFGTSGNRRYVAHSIIGMTQNSPAAEPYQPDAPILTSSCPTAVQPGTGHQALSTLTGGLRYGICETSAYNGILSSLAQSAIDLAFGY
jgi:hypothetical protein